MFWNLLLVALFLLVVLLFMFIDYNGEIYYALFLISMVLTTILYAILVPGVDYSSVKQTDLDDKLNRINEIVILLDRVENRADYIGELLNTAKEYNMRLGLVGDNNPNKDNFFYIHRSRFNISSYDYIDIDELYRRVE
jgi:hypothetical protein